MSIWNKLKSLFSRKKPTPVVSKPVVTPKPEDPASVGPYYAFYTDGVFLPREKVSEIMVGIIKNGAPRELTDFAGVGPLDVLRETHGKNRSPAIDILLKSQGGALGDPWCVAIVQYQIDVLCRILGVERKLVGIPEGVGSQRVYSDTGPAYKSSTPCSVGIICWRQRSDKSHGHFGVIPITPASPKSFTTFEGNTSARGSAIVRDGQGAAWKMRDDDGDLTLEFRGIIDLYEALKNAYKRQYKIS